jgi:hypothetical protein
VTIKEEKIKTLEGKLAEAEKIPQSESEVESPSIY